MSGYAILQLLQRNLGSRKARYEFRTGTGPDQGPAVINLSKTRASVVATPIVRIAITAKKMWPRRM
jgi:hypothetical protein